MRYPSSWPAARIAAAGNRSSFTGLQFHANRRTSSRLSASRGRV
jgi:hypothetical protein